MVPVEGLDGFAEVHGRRDGKVPGNPAAMAAIDWPEVSEVAALFGETAPLVTPNRAAS